MCSRKSSCNSRCSRKSSWNSKHQHCVRLRGKDFDRKLQDLRRGGGFRSSGKDGGNRLQGSWQLAIIWLSIKVRSSGKGVGNRQQGSWQLAIIWLWIKVKSSGKGGGYWQQGSWQLAIIWLWIKCFRTCDIGQESKTKFAFELYF